MKSNQVGILFSMCLAALGLFGAEARREDGVSVVTVDAKAVVGKAAPDLWGIFLEDLDLALDGGLYAEMVRNRSFEDGTFEPWDLTLDFWRENVNGLLTFQGQDVLQGSGHVSNVEMEEYAQHVYALFDSRRKKYEAQLAEEEDMKLLDDIESKVKKNKKR